MTNKEALNIFECMQNDKGYLGDYLSSQQLAAIDHAAALLREAEAAADFDALTQALADAKAERDRLQRELNFLTTEGEEKDGWCEHNRQYYESAVDGNGDSFDNCVMCERNTLRAENETLRAELARQIGTDALPEIL